MKLIMKGARRDIQDRNGRIPRDLILYNSSEEILSEAVKTSLMNHLVRLNLHQYLRILQLNAALC